jgi:predicted ATP-grasp superfamily ATP-dependent carboligase
MAHSALRAGLRPLCVDLFADRDLQAVATCHSIPIDDYPHGLALAFEKFPQVPWLYTGGLENHADLIDRWSRSAVLYGNTSEQLRRVRDPNALAKLMHDHGVRYPLNGPASPTKKWLVKPIHSTGGAGIRFWHGEVIESQEYLQEYLPGKPISAAFLCDGSRTSLLGTTQQLIGVPWLNASPFHYCGTIGPLSNIGMDAWQRVASALQASQLIGVVGVDALWNDGEITVLEVNPRYTAAFEVLEYATGVPTLDRHCQCFGHNFDRTAASENRSICVGKAIYFASETIKMPATGPWDDELRKPLDAWRLPMYADLSPVGTLFQPGDPVMTVLVKGANPEECLEKLQLSIEELRRIFSESLP